MSHPHRASIRSDRQRRLGLPLVLMLLFQSPGLTAASLKPERRVIQRGELHLGLAAASAPQSNVDGAIQGWVKAARRSGDMGEASVESRLQRR